MEVFKMKKMLMPFFLSLFFVVPLAMADNSDKPASGKGSPGRSQEGLKPDVVVVRPGFRVSETGGAEKPSKQIQKNIRLKGVNSVMLAWWFQHIADNEGIYWKSLSSENESIKWIISLEEATTHVGTLWESDQAVRGNMFPDNKLHMQVQYVDWNTRGRGGGPGKPTPLNPVLPPPADYNPPYPTPLDVGDINGFNEDMLFFDGHGFCPGRILWSWVNVGNNDTGMTVGQPFQVDLYCTFYLPWMKGHNLPPAMSKPGYYYSDEQIEAIWELWEKILNRLPVHLPVWWGDYSQDNLAREKGWTVSLMADTPLFGGVTSEMMVWWWNHAMGDYPGNGYVFWTPPFHHTIRWLPGYSPAEVLGTDDLPTDKVVPGAISPDLQGNSLAQDGGGMMWYPTSMSPIPGVYKTNQPMTIVTADQVANFENERWPEPAFGMWLLHQWEEVPGGLIHRSTMIKKLPLPSPITQEEYLTEHQYLEGQFMASGILIKLYNEWLEEQKGG